jgi:hypothetical protein
MMLQQGMNFDQQPFPGYSGRRAWWRLDPGKLKAVIDLLELY